MTVFEGSSYIHSGSKSASQSATRGLYKERRKKWRALDIVLNGFSVLRSFRPFRGGVLQLWIFLSKGCRILLYGFLRPIPIWFWWWHATCGFWERWTLFEIAAKPMVLGTSQYRHRGCIQWLCDTVIKLLTCGCDSGKVKRIVGNIFAGRVFSEDLWIIESAEELI